MRPSKFCLSIFAGASGPTELLDVNDSEHIMKDNTTDVKKDVSSGRNRHLEGSTLLT